MLRKAAPFLLIAILIACLFIKPQKEGMKSAKQWFEDHHGDNTHEFESSGLAAGVIYATYKGGRFTDAAAEDFSSSPGSASGEGMLVDAPTAIKADGLTSPKELPSHYENIGEQIKDSPVETTEGTIKFATENPNQFDADLAFDGGEAD